MFNPKLLLLLAVSAFPAVAQNPFEVHITLSSNKVLLGEPIWIDVTATNRSKHSLNLDWGTECPDFRSLPIHISISKATQGNGEPVFCGMPGGSCMMPAPDTLAPGESDSHRYVLKGDFRITQPGEYDVTIEKDLPYAEATGARTMYLAHDHLTQKETVQAKLTVTAPDPAKLLAIEQSLAAEITATLEQKKFTPSPGLSGDEYTVAFRAWSSAKRKEDAIAMSHRYAIAAGLAQFPAAGMEPYFANQTSYGNGIEALKNLNTPAARAAIAKLSEPIPERVVNGFKQPNSRWVALRVLGDMGDITYLPLIESYSNDPDLEVRRSSIFAAGNLGKAKALPFLDKAARTAQTDTERNDAVFTMGNTQSVEAVPLLIALFDTPPTNDPLSANYALLTLTHHKVSRNNTSREAIKIEWQTWWKQHAKDARAFSQYDCMTDNKEQAGPWAP